MRRCHSCGKEHLTKNGFDAKGNPRYARICYQCSKERPGKRTLRQRFDEAYEILGGCWIWRKALDKRGYGIFGVGTSLQKPAHRISWELHNSPIPEGMFVCHTCDVRNCVNPEHLFIGTQQDNMMDMVNKGRQTFGERNPKAKIKDDDVRQIRWRFRFGEKPGSICKDYPLSRRQIASICQGKSWKHVE